MFSNSVCLDSLQLQLTIFDDIECGWSGQSLLFSATVVDDTSLSSRFATSLPSGVDNTTSVDGGLPSCQWSPAQVLSCPHSLTQLDAVMAQTCNAPDLSLSPSPAHLSSSLSTHTL
jgi:hypothetical protein